MVMGESELAQAIYRTIRYFSLFDQPVTALEIWRTLVLPGDTTRARWGGRKMYRLHEIEQELSTSAWLRERMGMRDGYYCLRNQEGTVAQRLARHRLAQMKWKLTRRLARVLVIVPFVRMIALSGSLAAGNTQPASDLDIFVIARAGRIWTARLGLLCVTQLMGRRRRYTDEAAPDKLCLNHYLTDETLTIDPDIHNIYTAVLYQKLWPLFGLKLWQEFQRANAGWMKQFLMYPPAPPLPPVYAVTVPRLLAPVKRNLESLLGEPVMDWVEHLAEWLQRQAIVRHTRPNQTGRVILSDRELAFHPDTKVPGILAAFAQDEGQRQLL